MLFLSRNRKLSFIHVATFLILPTGMLLYGCSGQPEPSTPQKSHQLLLVEKCKAFGVQSLSTSDPGALLLELDELRDDAKSNKEASELLKSIRNVLLARKNIGTEVEIMASIDVRDRHPQSLRRIRERAGMYELLAIATEHPGLVATEIEALLSCEAVKQDDSMHKSLRFAFYMARKKHLKATIEPLLSDDNFSEALPHQRELYQLQLSWTDQGSAMWLAEKLLFADVAERAEAWDEAIELHRELRTFYQDQSRPQSGRLHELAVDRIQKLREMNDSSRLIVQMAIDGLKLMEHGDIEWDQDAGQMYASDLAKLLGTDSYEFLDAQTTLADLHLSAKDFKVAEDCCRKALSGLRELLGSTHFLTTQTTALLSKILLNSGKIDEAEVVAAKQLQVINESGLPLGISEAELIAQFAQVEKKQGRFSGAMQAWMKAAKIHMKESNSRTAADNILEAVTAAMEANLIEDAKNLLRAAELIISKNRDNRSWANTLKRYDELSSSLE